MTPPPTGRHGPGSGKKRSTPSTTNPSTRAEQPGAGPVVKPPLPARPPTNSSCPGWRIGYTAPHGSPATAPRTSPPPATTLSTPSLPPAAPASPSLKTSRSSSGVERAAAPSPTPRPSPNLGRADPHSCRRATGRRYPRRPTDQHGHSQSRHGSLRRASHGPARGAATQTHRGSR